MICVSGWGREGGEGKGEDQRLVHQHIHLLEMKMKYVRRFINQFSVAKIDVGIFFNSLNGISKPTSLSKKNWRL